MSVPGSERSTSYVASYAFDKSAREGRHHQWLQFPISPQLCFSFRFLPSFRLGNSGKTDPPSTQKDPAGDTRVLSDKDYEAKWKSDLETLLHEGDKGNPEITPWQQRRVLELLLFGRIVGEMTEQARLITREVVSRLSTDQPGTSSNDGHSSLILGKGLRSTRIQVEEIQDVLQRVEEDLGENIAEIDRWEKRETERQAERPRWTLHDESRYRVVLQKLQNSNDRKVETLRRARTKMANLKQSLEKKLDHRRSEDIERFTYVTVIFLPLGFGTSIFSMSETPEGHVVKGMAIAAVGALCATVVLLVVARYLAKHSSALTEAASRMGHKLTSRNGKKGDIESGSTSRA